MEPPAKKTKTEDNIATVLRKAETNFAALSKANQDKVLALFAKRDRQEQAEFEEAHETWFRCVLAHKEPPLEVVATVVRGMERGLVRQSAM